MAVKLATGYEKEMGLDILLNIYRLYVVTPVFPGAGDEADRGGTGEGEGLLLRSVYSHLTMNATFSPKPWLTRSNLTDRDLPAPGKLRDVEVMCQENEAAGGDCIRKVGIGVLKCQQAHLFLMCSTCLSQVLDILYQTEDGFAVPEEEEGGVPPPEEGEEEY